MKTNNSVAKEYRREQFSTLLKSSNSLAHRSTDFQRRVFAHLTKFKRTPSEYLVIGLLQICGGRSQDIQPAKERFRPKKVRSVIDLTYPALVEPLSPDMRTRQSSCMRSVLFIAEKNRLPTGTSREVIASTSSLLRVNRSRNRETIDCRVAMSCLAVQLT